MRLDWVSRVWTTIYLYPRVARLSLSPTKGMETCLPTVTALHTSDKAGGELGWGGVLNTRKSGCPSIIRR